MLYSTIVLIINNFPLKACGSSSAKNKDKFMGIAQEFSGAKREPK